MKTFPPGGSALVQGANRGIGLGLVTRLLAHQCFDWVIATCRRPETAQALRALDNRRLRIERLDISDPGQIESLAGRLREDRLKLRLVINAAGVLHGRDLAPEKRLEDLDADALGRVFMVNALGPILLLKALRPLLAAQGKVVVAAISARVGSIEDNRLGGWYAYRASKAALNQLLRTAAIELGRRNRNAIVAALHPGTTDTELSRPFQARVPEHKLFAVDKTVDLMLSVIDGLTEHDSGGFYAWDGRAIPW